MKTNYISHLVIITVLVISCSSCHRPQGDLPYIDVRKNYPQKEIFLTDIAEITYLHINSDDGDYLYSGTIRAITANTIVIPEPGSSSGNILFFDKDGQPKSRFNRLGNGPGEYRSFQRVLYDEDTDDVFVITYWDTLIRVYSSTGIYKRKIVLPRNTRMGNDIISFDDSSLFFYDANVENNRFDVNYKDLPASDLISPFYRISKTDGAVLDYLELPMAPIFLGIYIDGRPLPALHKTRLIKCAEGVLLCNPENDTVFLYGKEKSLTPILHKTPLANETNPMTYLNNCVDVGNYQFMEIYTVRAGDVYAGIFPVKYFIRNKKTGEIFQQKLIVPDYQEKEFIIGIGQARISGLENSVFFELDLVELKEAYAQNRLSGKLKELVAILKEDDNNVFMIVEFK